MGTHRTGLVLGAVAAAIYLSGCSTPGTFVVRLITVEVLDEENSKPIAGIQVQQVVISDVYGGGPFGIIPSFERARSRYYSDKQLTSREGIVTFGKVPFDVRGVIQLSRDAPRWRSFPRRVDGIAVNQKAQRLHFLQGTAGPEFFEATAEPEGVPWLWRQYAYRGNLTLQALDAKRRVPGNGKLDHLARSVVDPMEVLDDHEDGRALTSLLRSLTSHEPEVAGLPPEHVAQRREIRSFFIQEVDRDKIVLWGEP